jgi:hypothetical protein
MFVHFCERGIAFLSSDYFRGLLEFYKIKHILLNPNDIFHTSILIHFCEALIVSSPIGCNSERYSR